MENYIVSARKYRPATFDTVVGQESLTTTLKNAIRTGKLAHAYLFCGPRGVGKTTCARIFAKTINCLSPKENGEACDECESCKAFNEQRSLNIHELDAASNNSVDDIRSLIEQVRIPPQIGRYKVFIIDEVHMLSTQAFNAFLKTLEEPPAHAIFILATTEKHKLLPTILSRCQTYDFSRMTVKNTVEHLKRVAQDQGITYEEAALNVIAQKADGGMRDALSIFDQVASFSGGDITYSKTIANLNVLDTEYYFRLTDFFLTKNVTDIMLTLNEILGKGFDGQHFITGLGSHLRNLLMSRDPQTVSLIEATDSVRQHYAEQAQRCTPKFIYKALKLCNTCDLNYKASQNKRLLVELTLIEVAQATDDESSGLCPTKTLKPIFTVATDAGANPSKIDANHTAQPQAAVKKVATASAGSQETQEVSQGVKGGGIVIPSTAKGTSVKKNVHSVSIRGLSQTANDTSQHAATPEVRERTQAYGQTTLAKDIDPNDVIVAWREYAGTLPKESAALANRMNGTLPVPTSDKNVFDVTAANPSVLEQFNEAKKQIEAFIQMKVGNSNVRFNVRQAVIQERPKILSRSQQLEKMCEENPALRKLCDDFGLSLAL